MTLLHRTLEHHHTRASIATIKRHIASPRGLDAIAALRLLRRNVRDAKPGTAAALQASIARQVLELIKTGKV